VKNLKLWLSLGTIAYVVAWYIPVFLCSRHTIFVLSMKDQPIDWVETAGCLVASAAFFIGYWKYSSGNDFGFFKTRRNLFMLLLGLLLFVALGEELDWGQRVLHFGIPAAVYSANYQHEFNMKNLEYFRYTPSSGLKWLANPQTAFTLFWCTYGLLVPLFFAVSSPFRATAKKINLPIIPIWLGMGFAIDSLVWAGAVHWLPGKGCIEQFQQGPMETLMAFVAIYFLFNLRKRGLSNKPE
jgi:hypothetical protein